MQEKIKSIKLFIHYALPCVDFMLQRNALTESDFEQLRHALTKPYIANDDSRALEKLLERIFLQAIEKIKKLSKSNSWLDTDAIRIYFLKEHNKTILSNEGIYGNMKPQLKQLCMVHCALAAKDYSPDSKIVEVLRKSKTQCKESIESILNPYKLAIKKDDIIAVHWKAAVDIVPRIFLDDSL